MSAASELAGSDEAQMNMTPMIDVVFNLLIFFMLISDLQRKDIVEMTLPVAYMAEEDKGKEEDDRIILNVDRQGVISWKGQTKTLDELGSILSTARDRYEHKLRSQGKPPYEELPGGGRASKLYVLLRADKDSPWQHVQWLMTIMAEQKLYKLQFATKQFRDGHIEKEEAEALDAVDQRTFKAMQKGKEQ